MDEREVKELVENEIGEEVRGVKKYNDDGRIRYLVKLNDVVLVLNENLEEIEEI